MKLATKQLRLLQMMDEIDGYAILLLDKFGNIETWNKGAEKIKGYTADEAIGKDFSIFYTETDREKGTPGAMLAEAASKGQVHHESWRIRKDGSEFWGSITIRAIHDDDAQVVGFAKITRDLTERKFAENIIKQQVNELESKNKELEQFVYIASHDLQEPLLTVTNFIDLLKDEYHEKLDENAFVYFDFMGKSVARMKELIKDLLDYSRIGRQKELCLVDCNQLLSAIELDMDSAISHSGAIIVNSNLPAIDVYPTEFRQLLQNLISNAIKFQAPGNTPKIVITAYSDRRFWYFTVQDNGIGIDKLHKNKIFMIFQRLNNRDAYDGTGIGLAHCKKIVEMHGGKIYVESNPGEGSAFHFTIPVTI